MNVVTPPTALLSQPTAPLFPPPPPRRMSEAEYLSLDTNRLVEYIDGFAEELPVATDPHQAISGELYDSLKAFVRTRRLGTVRYAPVPVRVEGVRYREPDVMYLSMANEHRRHEQYWIGADLVMEVVSEDRRRDLADKRTDYARAGIPEYWIVDPLNHQITVLTLAGGTYVEAGVYAAGRRAASVLLAGFDVAVDDVFAAD